MAQTSAVGTDYVGLTTGACFADLGIDNAKIANLRRGIIPINKPGVEDMVRRNVAAGGLKFTTS